MIQKWRVLGKLRVRNLYTDSVAGNTKLLKNGLKLIDEKGNIFLIESVAMTHYKNVEDYKTHANLLLNGDVENSGLILSIAE